MTQHGGIHPVELVERYVGLKALVVGDAMLDTYLEGTANRLCREAPVPVVEKRSEYRCPGGAANIAANLRALGAEVVFVGLVGDDVAGSHLRTSLQTHGVIDRWLVVDANVSTLHKVRILADGQYLARLDEGDLGTCSPSARQAIMKRTQSLLDDCDLVVVSDYDGGTIGREVVELLRRHQANRRGVLAVDARQPRRYARVGATVMTPNLQEARATASFDPWGPEPPPAEIGLRARESLDTECLMVTMGARGVLLVDSTGKTTHLPTYPVVRASDVGAGDSFAAAMALALAAGADRHTAAEIGIDAASLACTKPRTAIITRQELLGRVNLSHHAVSGKNLTLKDIVVQLDADRRAGRRIVFTNGVFDILHAGHVRLLQRAKKLGDVLVVGINSDASVHRLKGEQRPINREQDRLALVSALDVVDHALVFSEPTPAEMIRAVRPDVHVKGGDYTVETLPEIAAVREVGASVEILPLHDELSTTSIIERIVSRPQADSQEPVR